MEGRVGGKCLNVSWGGGGGRAWIRFIWLKMGTGGGLYECGNELWVSIKCGDFFD